MNLSGSGVGSSYPRIPSLQLKGCEVMAHFLGSVPEDLDVPKFSFSLGKQSSVTFLSGRYRLREIDFATMSYF